MKLAPTRASGLGLGATGCASAREWGLSRRGGQDEGRREARRQAPRQEPRLWEAGHLMLALFDESQVAAYAALVFLCAGRPSDALIAAERPRQRRRSTP